MPHLIQPKIRDTIQAPHTVHRTQVTLLQVLAIHHRVLAIHHTVVAIHHRVLATHHRVLATLPEAMVLGHLLLQGSLTRQVSQS